ncbi:hypothetical protein [Pontibacter ruber]|uniref:Uncharacterized protein n=1 Tax=Pontibacter ruber TaxID=1343895 RepID=A0ABW5CU22_9BACT|nr:hypothetical protein [Pontibacter ruber]
MTKGHNQGRDKASWNDKEKQGKHQNSHLPDQKKDKGPQGRHENKDESGGTKGKNAI